MSEEFPEYTEEIGSCKECGNSPTNHFLTKMVSTMDVYIGTFSMHASRLAPFRAISDFGQYSGNWVIRLAAEGLYALGVITYAHDPAQAKSYRSRVIWEEAQRRGIEMEQIVIVGERTDTYRAKINGSWFYFESLPIPPTYEKISMHWVGDKVLLKRALEAHQIPVPKYKSVRTFDQARDFLNETRTVVVKPRVGTRGRHTTVSVRTIEELKEALQSAKVLCAFASVEEELEGSVCRGTVVNGKLVGFFQADPAIVTGDGKSTLRELIEAANETREARVAQIELNQENLAYLERHGLTLESVPEKGTLVRIGHRTGRLFGGNTRELLETVHQHLQSYLEKAATVLDTPVVGFDLIIQDPEAEPDTQKWGIIEANTLPFIDLHYLPLHGRPSNPAAAVWDLWKSAQ